MYTKVSKVTKVLILLLVEVGPIIALNIAVQSQQYLELSDNSSGENLDISL